MENKKKKEVRKVKKIKEVKVVECDDREDGSIIEGLRELGCDVVIKRLEVGDYVCGDICIERKTIDDFCGSIVDGRLRRQREKMLEKFGKGKCFVLISGRINERRNLDFNENCILGMIASLVSKGVSVICVDNSRQLVWIMNRIFERFNE